jgi:hypothetical protein
MSLLNVYGNKENEVSYGDTNRKVISKLGLYYFLAMP